jgi:hypothetical protein
MSFMHAACTGSREPASGGQWRVLGQYLACLLLAGGLYEASGAFEDATLALKEGASLVSAPHAYAFFWFSWLFHTAYCSVHQESSFSRQSSRQMYRN